MSDHASGRKPLHGQPDRNGLVGRNARDLGQCFHKNNGGGVGTSFLCKNSGPDTDFHVVPACSQTKPKSTPPCYVKLSGNGQGDIFFDILVAVTTAPDGTKTFDPTGYNGH